MQRTLTTTIANKVPLKGSCKGYYKGFGDTGALTITNTFFFFFWGGVIVEWAPKPYSSYSGPCGNLGEHGFQKAVLGSRTWLWWFLVTIRNREPEE